MAGITFRKMSQRAKFHLLSVVFANGKRRTMGLHFKVTISIIRTIPKVSRSAMTGKVTNTTGNKSIL